MELFLIRHGQTDDNLKGYYTGRRPTGLNAEGNGQIRRTARELARFSIPDVVCSPLKRARQSARLLCDAWGVLRPVPDPDWTEMDFGDVSGLTYDELAKRLPEALQGWADDWFGYTLPGGENGEAMYARVERAIHRLLTRPGNGRVAVVTHLGCIRFALSRLLSGGPGRFWDFSVGNGGYAHLRTEGREAELVRVVEEI